MSQIDDDLDFEALLVDKQQEAPPTVKEAAPVAAPAEEEEDQPDWMADELATIEKAAPLQRKLLVEVEGDDPLDFLSSSGIKPDRTVPDLKEPWMNHHKFTLVTSVEQVNQIVDECIRAGSCSLDLETEGLDNRIQYRADNSPETVHKIVGFCISHDGKEGFYIPVRHTPTDGGPDLNVRPIEQVEAAISRLCHAAIPEGTPEDKAADPLSYKCSPPKLVIYFWNAQFDQEFLYPVTGIDWWHPSSFEDGMLASFCIYAGDKQLGLKPKAKEFLRDPDGNPYTMIKLKDLFFGRAKDIRFALLAPDEPGVLRYAGSDAICTYLLCKLPRIVPLCHERHGNIYRIEKQTSCALRPMERARIRINREHVRGLLLEQEAIKAELVEKIRRFSIEARGMEVDPNSPKQLSEFLFGEKPGGLDITPKPEKNAASGQYKTDGETLELLAKAPKAPTILKDIVRYREVDKFIGTYLLGLTNNPDENDEIRVSFKQTGAASGRFSAPAGEADQGYSGIPVHGIPKDSDLRRDFVGRLGFAVLKADYAGQELRIGTNVAVEKAWIEEFLKGSGDLHTLTARAFFGKEDVSKEERGMGKAANFALLYGGGTKALMAATGCDEMEAKRRKHAFDKALPNFAAWVKKQHQKVKDQLGVTTAFGRWLSLPDARHEDRAVQAAVERHAVNYQIQGAGADIMKISLILLTKKFHKEGWLKNGGDDSVRMLLTVHDEIVFEVRYDRVAEVLPIIVDLMESPWRLPNNPRWVVPLIVEPLVGFNWKSGFAVERAKKERDIKESEIDRYENEIPLRKHEVLMNGFVYSTTRKAEKDKATKQVTEAPDQQEVLEGDVFRIIDAPWLVGKALPPTPGPGSGGAPPEPKPEAPKAVYAEPVPIRAAAQPVRAVSPIGAPPPWLKRGELKLRIEKLTLQTADQVCDVIVSTTDRDDGLDLHLTDVSGTVSLFGPWICPVNKKRFMDCLGRLNLLCEAENEYGAQEAS
jgi:DNA polymerase I-like protein with 3'-5' exonuclease and polymerase domains